MYSCALVQRSVTLSGIGLGLLQMMSWRRYHPSACKGKATRRGCRSVLRLQANVLRTRVTALVLVVMPFVQPFVLLVGTSLFCSRGTARIAVPRFNHSVPSSASISHAPEYFHHARNVLIG